MVCTDGTAPGYSTSAGHLLCFVAGANHSEHWTDHDVDHLQYVLWENMLSKGLLARFHPENMM